MNNMKEKIKPSTWMWNGIGVAAFVASAFVYPDAALIIWAFANIMALAIMIDGESDTHLWMWLTGIVWIMAIFAGIILIGQLAFSRIAQFNDWFNEKVTQLIKKLTERKENKNEYTK
jgi:hypothetical protein